MRNLLTPSHVAIVLIAVLGIAGTATASSLITSAKIQDGTIQARDLSKGLRAAIYAPPSNRSEGTSGAAGATGSAGATGPQGPAGARGTDGVSGHDGAANVAVVSQINTAPSGIHGESIQCPAGMHGIAGAWAGGNGQVTATSIGLNPTTVSISYNNSGGDQVVTFYATCAS